MKSEALFYVMSPACYLLIKSTTKSTKFLQLIEYYSMNHLNKKSGVKPIDTKRNPEVNNQYSYIIDSDNGLPPGRRQAIIWTTAGIQ